METYEKTFLEILRDNCRENDTNTNDLNWYYWRIHRLEKIVELLIKENAELRAAAGL